MCAINPAHKKRIILDIYTADSKMTKEQFEEHIWNIILPVEIQLNSTTPLRWHVKESDQQAE